MKKSYAFAAALLCMLVMGSCTTTYYFVRHAEKRNGSDTSTLTEAGQQRALALRDRLRNEGIESIYASVYVRTQLTAQPLAAALNKQLIIYRPDTTAGLAERLKKLNGTTVLVVGHSNTIPDIIQRIADETVTINENDFDNLFKVRRVKQLFWTSYYVDHLTYGAPSP